ncbi:collagen alpha-1(I) chain-like [Oenanthe melanoleuca]|uniref:collagen alpha-1(I) chain-like n=1 Tax=Oenanthe melanoleuca TaxID=2939378 RepID=UPI0024C1E1C0|nr:collagen alpha-1(I) chain-like [Oenanthe melanoleuca]
MPDPQSRGSPCAPRARKAPRSIRQGSARPTPRSFPDPSSLHPSILPSILASLPPAPARRGWGVASAGERSVANKGERGRRGAARTKGSRRSRSLPTPATGKIPPGRAERGATPDPGDAGPARGAVPAAGPSCGAALPPLIRHFGDKGALLSPLGREPPPLDFGERGRAGPRARTKPLVSQPGCSRARGQRWQLPARLSKPRLCPGGTRLGTAGTAASPRRESPESCPVPSSVPGVPKPPGPVRSRPGPVRSRPRGPFGAAPGPVRSRSEPFGAAPGPVRSRPRARSEPVGAVRSRPGARSEPPPGPFGAGRSRSEPPPGPFGAAPGPVRSRSEPFGAAPGPVRSRPFGAAPGPVRSRPRARSEPVGAVRSRPGARSEPPVRSRPRARSESVGAVRSRPFGAAPGPVRSRSEPSELRARSGAGGSWIRITGAEGHSGTDPPPRAQTSPCQPPRAAAEAAEAAEAPGQPPPPPLAPSACGGHRGRVTSGLAAAQPWQGEQ